VFTATVITALADRITSHAQTVVSPVLINDNPAGPQTQLVENSYGSSHPTAFKHPFHHQPTWHLSSWQGWPVWMAAVLPGRTCTTQLHHDGISLA
jgi:hypothetical protein